MIFPLLLALSLQLPGVGAPPTVIVNMPRLIAESMAGKAATAQLRAFQAEKQKAISEKQMDLEKLNQASALPAQIARAQLELQRLTQDAEAELAALNRQVQAEFDKKLRPVVAQIAEEDHIGVIFEYPQVLIVWVAPSLDITAKVIERLDAASREKK